jgi:hypothetical protein
VRELGAGITQEGEISLEPKLRIKLEGNTLSQKVE